MAIYQVRQLSQIQTPDDAPLFVVRRDLSGGVNSRQNGSLIGETQATALYNADIGTGGESSKRPGSVLIGNDVGNDSIIGLHNFIIQGATDQLLAYEDTTLWNWLGSGNWASLKADFTTSTEVGMISAKESGLSPDDIVIIQNGVDNAFRLDAAGNFQDLGSTAGTGSDSPPKSTVMCWYGNRVWVLLNDLLYFSDAYSADYSTAFDTVSNSFRLPVGAERGLVATRDTGIVVMGDQAIWGIAPSATPSATDKPEPLITNHGVVSKKGWCQAGGDIYYFAQDGLRALKRTLQDKLQEDERPISYNLKDEFDRISWAYIDRLEMKYFDNKIFVSVPTGASSFDTWVYYTATKSFMIIQGWSPRCFEVYKIDGEEGLYYGKQGNGVVYHAWYGYTDEGTTTTNGTAINFQEEGRKEDLDQPLVKKSGGEVGIKAKSSGNYDVEVWASFDDAPYTLLGTMNLLGSFITFPTTFPLIFTDATVIREKFHLDSYGSWNTCRIKIVHNDTNSTNAITIYERSIVSYPEIYETEVP